MFRTGELNALVLETIWCDTGSSFCQVTLAPVWIVIDAGWNENPCMTTVCDAALALGLGLDVAILVLAFDVAVIVVALTVAVLGLGLGFHEDNCHKEQIFFHFSSFLLYMSAYPILQTGPSP